MLVFVPEITPRVEYIFSFILDKILGQPVQFTTDREEFHTCNGKKFSYSRNPLGKELHFPSSSFLFEDNISQRELIFTTYKDYKIIFPVSGGPFPFDVFAAAFYLLSRYEEYLPSSRDHLGRFKAKSSVASKGGFLEIPVIDQWARDLEALFKNHFKDFSAPEPSVRIIPTIDIDNAWAYRYKGVFKNYTRIFLNLLLFRFKRVKKRLAVLSGIKSDPYDSYEKQFALHKRYNYSPLYFVLLGDHGKYDRNLSHRNRKYRKLIKELDSNGKVNLHPSFGSNRKQAQVEKEKGRLEGILEREVKASRQHYIMLHLPSTYQRLLQTGITDDYSMGYPETGGFRAGTSNTFNFFDLERNCCTDLVVHPFVIMDSTLKFYLKKRAKGVMPYVRQLYSRVSDYGGDFCYIFHNESIGARGRWKNWTNMYEEFLKLPLSHKDDE